MNYEQRHKEVLDAIKKLQEDNPSDDGIQNWVNENFPELAESEDEKIRKELIEAVKETPACIGFNNKNAVLAWLEKQDEQKASVVDFKAKDWYVSKVDGKIHNIYNSVDKVQPKFREGDWTVSNLDGKARQISEVHFDEYNSYYVVNGMTVNLEEFDRRHHIWSIVDARDGDILSNGKMIVIFKNFEEPSYKQHIKAYIGLDIFGRIQVTDEHWELGIDKVKPATKEQCEFLFQKMQEYGYKWNNEKKELLEIEEELTDFEKSLKHIMIETIECGDTRNLKADAEMLLRIAQKSTNWSEEDEDDLNNIIWLCNNCIRKRELTWVPSQATRIKSLIERIKDIVFVQPKHELGE